MVLVHIQIAARREIHIQPAVARDLLQHVIEESNSRRDLRLAAAIEVQPQADVGFFRPSLQRRLPHSNLFSSWRSSRVCASVPSVIRTYPSPPKSLERSRTRIPLRANAATTRFVRLPSLTSTKLPPVLKHFAPNRFMPRANSTRLRRTSRTVRAMKARSCMAASEAASAAAFTG